VSTLLLDASVILAAFDRRDRNYESAKRLMADNSLTLATLDFARYEVANTAVRGWGAPDSVGPLLFALDQIADDGGVVLSTSALLARAAELAARHTISVYDAAYVAAWKQAIGAWSVATSATWSRRVSRCSPALTRAPLTASPEHTQVP
jgi:predicted nucleic acid-binding protein